MFTNLRGVSVTVMVALALALLGGVAYLVGHGLSFEGVGVVLLAWSLLAGVIALRE